MHDVEQNSKTIYTIYTKTKITYNIDAIVDHQKFLATLKFTRTPYIPKIAINKNHKTGIKKYTNIHATRHRKAFQNNHCNQAISDN